MRKRKYKRNIFREDGRLELIRTNTKVIVWERSHILYLIHRWKVGKKCSNSVFLWFEPFPHLYHLWRSYKGPLSNVNRKFSTNETDLQNVSIIKSRMTMWWQIHVPCACPSTRFLIYCVFSDVLLCWCKCIAHNCKVFLLNGSSCDIFGFVPKRSWSRIVFILNVCLEHEFADATLCYQLLCRSSYIGSKYIWLFSWMSPLVCLSVEQE